MGTQPTPLSAHSAHSRGVAGHGAVSQHENHPPRKTYYGVYLGLVYLGLASLLALYQMYYFSRDSVQLLRFYEGSETRGAERQREARDRPALSSATPRAHDPSYDGSGKREHALQQRVDAFFTARGRDATAAAPSVPARRPAAAGPPPAAGPPKVTDVPRPPLRCTLTFRGPCPGQPSSSATRPYATEVPLAAPPGMRGSFFALLCHEEHVRWQNKCGAGAIVTKEYVGPGATTDTAPDGSWNVTDVDGSVLRLQPASRRPLHSCYELRGETTEQQEPVFFCYPLLNIVGNAKCGSSALYHLLGAHPRLAPAFPKNKEYCLFERTIYDYLNGFRYGMYAVKDKDRVLFNGCISYLNSLTFDLILKQPKSLNLYLVREIAAHGWGKYNFWCTAAIGDGDCENINHWTVVGVHRRSPEHFHDLIARGAGAGFLPSRESVRGFFTGAIKRITADGKHLTVLSSEMLKGDIHRLWDIVARDAAEHVGLTLSAHPALEELKDVVVNSNNNKGSKAVSTSGSVQEGRYEISGYKPMLEETRELLLSWWEECEELRRITGWEGYECRSGAPGTTEDTTVEDKSTL